MRIFVWGLAALIALIVIVAINSFYVVRQDQQALVLQLGNPVAVRNAPGTDEAGLYFKTPLVQQVTILDRKNLGTDISDIEVLASDQRRLVVDAFVRWRISDPLRFYQRLRTELAAEAQLERFTESAIREALGDVPVPEIVSGSRAELMNRIRSTVNNNLEQSGIDIIDVRIRQADLPQAIAEGVYDRMRSARQQEAERIRAEGDEQAQRIRAEGQREATVIRARAREESEKIRGEGVLRPIYLYPMALSFIVTGTAWKWFLDPGIGLENTMHLWGWTSFSFDWIKNRDFALYTVVIAAVWQSSGFVMAMFLAGLRGIDNEILKAAQMDGASNYHLYRRIIIPQLRPAFLSAFVILAHLAIKSYDLVIALTGGGPGRATELPATFMYSYTFSRNQMGIGAASAVIMLMTVAAIIVPYLYAELKEKK